MIIFVKPTCKPLGGQLFKTACSCVWELRRVLAEEYLPRCLAELCDLNLFSFSLEWIVHLLQIDPALVCYRVEDVVVIDRTLFHAKDKVNPFVKMFWDVVAFESSAVFNEKILRISRPFWQSNIAYFLAIRPRSKFQCLLINKECTVRLEKLRGKLFHVSWIC